MNAHELLNARVSYAATPDTQIEKDGVLYEIEQIEHWPGSNSFRLNVDGITAAYWMEWANAMEHACALMNAKSSWLLGGVQLYCTRRQDCLSPGLFLDDLGDRCCAEHFPFDGDA